MKKKIAFLTSLFLTLASVMADAGTIQLPQTGQTKCYNTVGSEIACSGTGQDGDIRAGASWPEPRFTDTDGSLPISGNIILDKLTGLEWAKDGGAPTYTGNVSTCTGSGTSWFEAHDYVACLNENNYLGHSDWRVPNIIELESLVNVQQSDTAAWLNSQGFRNAVPYYYWSSSTIASNTDYAWNVNMKNGNVYDFDIAMLYPCCKDYNGYYVWPVRSGQCGSGNSALCLPKTGQTISYTAGDDGALQKGVAWPVPRFRDNNEMVTDNLTGLIWTKNAKTPGPAACNPGYKKKWQEAFNYVACLNVNNYLGNNDWRLPNRKELISLTDYSKYSPAIPAGTPFTNVQTYGYWSSSTDADFAGYAWVVGDGYVSTFTKGSWSNYYVWPVRGGQIEDAINYYCDSDGDDYISSAVFDACRGSGCIPAGCRETPGDDCNDNNVSINPGAAENCDKTDNNCNGQIDEGLPLNTYYRDADGDGYGNPNVSAQTCSPSPGYIADNTDCNDNEKALSPGATESISVIGTCSDGKDNDCDGSKDLQDSNCPANRLKVNISGKGTVTSNLLGIRCKGVCSTGYIPDTSVILTANPLKGYKFKKWSGACKGTKKTCKLTMSRTQTVTAVFKKK